MLELPNLPPWMTNSGTLAALVIGALLLLLGRRLYWLALGVAGFLLGAWLGGELVQSAEPGVALLAGLVLGLAGAVLAILAQKIAVAVGGVVIGGYAGLWVAAVAGINASPGTWLALLVGAVIGVLVATALFELALIFFTSLLGASLITEVITDALSLSPGLGLIAFVALLVVGLIAQSGGGPRRRRRV